MHEKIEITPEVFQNLKPGDILSNKWYDASGNSLGWDYEVVEYVGGTVKLRLVCNLGPLNTYDLTQDVCIYDTELYLVK